MQPNEPRQEQDWQLRFLQRSNGRECKRPFESLSKNESDVKKD
jgi:hypothetical protein